MIHDPYAYLISHCCAFFIWLSFGLLEILHGGCFLDFFGDLYIEVGIDLFLASQ